MRLPEPFRTTDVDAGGVRIRAAVGGDGPPLLLLHGYPQTHLIWHDVAPRLAGRFTVVATDLRGYGDSDRPAPGPGDEAYAKRAMADDQLAVMAALGFDRFGVAGHDRGGRVAHRLALDAPEAVSALAVLDIVPTRHALRHADADFGHGYWHWFFLTAPAGIPERLIGNDPEFWITARMRSRHHGGTPFDPAAVAEYVRCFADPAAIAASCADYRAAAGIDLAHDDADAGRLVQAPLLALWGAHSFVGRTYDVPGVWREYARDVVGVPVDADHYLPEERPEAVAEHLAAFFG
jgi:haloacetate dehalogenase